MLHAGKAKKPYLYPCCDRLARMLHCLRHAEIYLTFSIVVLFDCTDAYAHTVPIINRLLFTSATRSIYFPINGRLIIAQLIFFLTLFLTQHV